MSAEYCPNTFQGPHCLHPTGTSWSHGWGGADEMICCNCGVLSKRRWSIQEKQIPGHGPHFKQKSKEYDP